MVHIVVPIVYYGFLCLELSLAIYTLIKTGKSSLKILLIVQIMIPIIWICLYVLFPPPRYSDGLGIGGVAFFGLPLVFLSEAILGIIGTCLSINILRNEN